MSWAEGVVTAVVPSELDRLQLASIARAANKAQISVIPFIELSFSVAIRDWLP
jgi:hypothetical protein